MNDEPPGTVANISLSASQHLIQAEQGDLLVSCQPFVQYEEDGFLLVNAKGVCNHSCGRQIQTEIEKQTDGWAFFSNV